jgi:hypothetical protein
LVNYTVPDGSCRSLENTVRVNATDACGPIYTDPATEIVTIKSGAAITITKTANTSILTGSGQVIGYTITVCNTGKSTLYNLQVRDNRTGDYPIGPLTPGQCNTTTRPYIVTSSDITNGSVVNVARVNATDICISEEVNSTATLTLQKNTVCCSCSPYVKFTYATGPVNATGYYPVQFTDTTTGPLVVQWYWKFGDGTTSTVQNPVHYYKPGSYTVVMYVKWVDCYGRTSTYWKTATQTITVP